MSIGILVTWAVGTVAAYLLFDLSFEVALELGAVLVVSGPTVVGPLLDFIRPSKTVNSVLKWEGTLADPIGATLGVVVFNAMVAGHGKAGQKIFSSSRLERTCACSLQATGQRSRQGKS